MCIYTTTLYTNLSLCAYKAAKRKNSLFPIFVKNKCGMKIGYYI